MTENLLEASVADSPSNNGAECPAVVGQRAARPAGLPDKFWDEKNSQVRLDALVKSYLELERKLGAPGGRDIPPDPDSYKVNVASELLTADPDVNRPTSPRRRIQPGAGAARLRSGLRTADADDRRARLDVRGG